MRGKGILVLAIVAGGSVACEREVPGRWVSARRVSQTTGIVDSLELLPDGKGTSHRLMLTITPVALREDTLVKDFERQEIRWEIKKNDDGRHLCITRVRDAAQDCAPLTVVPETEIKVGTFTYKYIRP